MKFYAIIFALAPLAGLCQSLGEIAGSPEGAAAAARGEFSSGGAKAAQSASAKAAKTPTRAEIEKLLSRAQAGDALAQLAVGTYYAKGEAGFPQDSAAAMRWLEKSSDGGNAAAMSYLGYIYAEGRLVPRDMKKAVELRERGAELGDSAAKWTLGSAYLYGFLVPKNPGRAVYWIEAAARAGYPEAQKKIAEIYSRMGNQEKLAEWNAVLAKSRLAQAEGGDASAMFETAENFMNGSNGFPRHRARAVFWYKRAAEAGDADAMAKVAKMYALGRFLPRDAEKALDWYGRLARRDSAYYFKVSAMFAEGSGGFPQDAKKSLEWYEAGAEVGDVSVKIRLVWKYWKAGERRKAAEYCAKAESLERANLERMKIAEGEGGVGGALASDALRTLAKMRSDIEAGADAPADFMSYLKSIKNNNSAR